MGNISWGVPQGASGVPQEYLPKEVLLLKEDQRGTGHVGTGHVGTGHVGTGHVGMGREARLR